MYRYDIHLHTKETSRCGYVKAPELVSEYKRHGYTGICITDHLNEEDFITVLRCRDDWNACVDQYMFGYNEAKKAGDAIGLTVMFGIELRFLENMNDYLIYGVDEDWLRANPYINRMDHETFFKKYGGEVLIVHAHPCRNGDEFYPDCIHGLEIVNCNPRHDGKNEAALALARAYPNLIRVCGSDAHRPGDEGLAAVVPAELVHDSFELKAVIESGRFKLWCPTFSEIIAESEADLWGTTH